MGSLRMSTVAEEDTELELGEVPAETVPATGQVVPPEPPPPPEPEPQVNLNREIAAILDDLEHYPTLVALDDQDEIEHHGNLTATLIDLQSLCDTIKWQGGVNHSLAMALEAVAPDAIDLKRYPLASFTVAPSHTNLKPTLEALSTTAKAVLLAIGAALVAALIKAIRWIIDTIRNASKREDDNEIINENIIILNELTREMMVRGGTKLTKLAEKSSEEVTEQANTELRGKHNDLAHDQVFGGPVSKVLHDFGARMTGFVTLIDQKVSSYHSVLQKAQSGGHTGDMLSIISELNTIAKPIPLGNLETLFKTAVPTFKGPFQLDEASKAFKEHVLVLNESRTTKELTREKVMAMVNARRFSFSTTYFKDSEKTLNAFNALQRRVEGLEQGVDPANFTTEITQAMRKAAFSIRSEMQALAAMSGSVAVALAAVHTVAGITFRVESAMFRAFANAALMSDEVAIQNIGRDAKRKLQEQLKRK